MHIFTYIYKICKYMYMYICICIYIYICKCICVCLKKSLKILIYL